MVGGVLSACLGVLYIPRWGVEMGCYAPISTFPRARATNLGFRDILYFIKAISMDPLHRRCGRCGELRTAKQVGAPLRHGKTERCETRSEARSLLECGARTSCMHLETKVDVI